MPMPPLDMAALGWLLLCWIGYHQYSERLCGETPNLMTAMYKHRIKWMLEMTKRDLRVADASLMGSVVNSVAIFASTSVLIVGGLAAALGGADLAQEVSADLPFLTEETREMWVMKLLTLMVVFIYAFFKFAWAMRQYNYTQVLIGCVPGVETPEEERYQFAKRAAVVMTLGAKASNRGLRAFYFGLGALSWFLHPILFITASAWVVWVLYRREFRSRIFKALNDEEVEL